MSIHLEQIEKIFTNRNAGYLRDSRTMQSAVFIPLFMKNEELHVLFEVRSMKLKTQPGEICFPGGKIDPSDENEEMTAKRELCEELGLTTADIETIAPLDILVTPYRGTIFPYLGQITSPEKIQPNEEVEEVFAVPLQFLLDSTPLTYKMKVSFEPDDDFPLDIIANKEAYKKRTSTNVELFYRYEKYVIWGLTGRILHHFLEQVRKEI